MSDTTLAGVGLDADPLPTRFLLLLPRIEIHAQISFRAVRCSQARADLVAEAVALAWQWYRRLARRGKDAAEFPSVFAHFATRAVRAGRRLAGMNKARDACNRRTQRRLAFTVEPLPDFNSLAGGPLADALRDNAVTPPPEAAAFRIDFAAWLGRWGGRDRQLIRDLTLGERAVDLARHYGVTKARISQKRRQFRVDWERFVAAPEDKRWDPPQQQYPSNRAVPQRRHRLQLNP